MGAGWDQESLYYEHTFSTGRVARLRRSVNIFGLQMDAMQLVPKTDESGELTDVAPDSLMASGAVVLSILQSLWVSPRVLGPGDMAFDEKEDTVDWLDLSMAEIAETLEKWGEAAAKAATFLGDLGGDGDRDGRPGVGDKAKRPARPKTGKR